MPLNQNDTTALITKAIEGLRTIYDTQLKQLQAQIVDLQQKSLSNLDSHRTLPPHYHNNHDNTAVSSDDLVPYKVVSSVPTTNALEGTIRLYVSGTTYKLYIRLNKGWRSITLT